MRHLLVLSVGAVNKNYYFNYNSDTNEEPDVMRSTVMVYIHLNCHFFFLLPFPPMHSI